MAGLLARGTMKPPLGAHVNMAHPLGQNAVLVIPFAEGFGTSPSVLYGSAPAQPLAIATGAPGWGSNREGIAANCLVADSYQVGTGSAWLPTSAVTVAIIRRKHDVTARSSGLFGMNTGANGLRCGAHVPYNDGVVYWDCGGTSAPNRLSVASLTFSITIPERWIFTAGPLGSAIWQNGIKVASQSTAVTRTASTAPFLLNSGNTGDGDILDLNYVAVYNTQWSDQLCRWWSAEPYAHLYTEQQRTYQFLSVLPAGFVVTHPRSAFGGQKPSRRRTHR